MANLQIIPLNSCENFGKSRISADKRFQMYLIRTQYFVPIYIPPRLTPDRGLCETVCIRKFTNKIRYKTNVYY